MHVRNIFNSCEKMLWLNIIILVLLLLVDEKIIGIVVVVAATQNVTVYECGPLYTTPKAKCIVRKQKCMEQLNIKIKWCVFFFCTVAFRKSDELMKICVDHSFIGLERDVQVLMGYY